jgi:hypothetical protein
MTRMADSLTMALLIMAKACGKTPMLFVSDAKWSDEQEAEMFKAGYAPIQVSPDEYSGLPDKGRYKTHGDVFATA